MWCCSTSTWLLAARVPAAPAWRSAIGIAVWEGGHGGVLGVLVLGLREMRSRKVTYTQAAQTRHVSGRRNPARACTKGRNSVSLSKGLTNRDAASHCERDGKAITSGAPSKKKHVFFSCTYLIKRNEIFLCKLPHDTIHLKLLVFCAGCRWSPVGKCLYCNQTIKFF